LPPSSDEKICANLTDFILSAIPQNCTRKKTCHSFEPCDKMNKVMRGV